MSEARQQQDRAARYVLRADDESLLRVGAPDSGGKYHTRINNISSTGLSFVIHAKTIPDLGDLIGEEIELELLLPTRKQKIFFPATVVRITDYEPDVFEKMFSPGNLKHKVVVGVKYCEIPAEHKKLIEEALESKYFEIKQRKSLVRVQSVKKFFVSALIKFVIYFAVISSTVVGGYYLYKTFFKPGP